MAYTNCAAFVASGYVLYAFAVAAMYVCLRPLSKAPVRYLKATFR